MPGQLALSLIADHYGLFGIDVKKATALRISGTIIVFLGTGVSIWIKFKRVKKLQIHLNKTRDVIIAPAEMNHAMCGTDDDPPINLTILNLEHKVDDEIIKSSSPQETDASDSSTFPYSPHNRARPSVAMNSLPQI
jgi:hypothetical protein